MQYRNIGTTGKQAGVVGLGCEQLDNKPYEQVEETIHAALDCGVNYLDMFMPGAEVRQNVAKALGPRRGDVMIQGHIGSTDVGRQYAISRDMPTVTRYFEDCLRAFGGYIDFGMLFYIDSEEHFRKVFDGGSADYALKLRDRGDIGHIGFSSHNPVLAARAIETGLPEVMMFSVNLAFDLIPSAANALDALHQNFEGAELPGLDPDRAALYALCAQRGIGVSVMKTFGAGKLITPEHTPFSRPMSVNQCMHYALSRPAVFSALLGCQTGAEVRGAMAYLEASDEDRDYTPFLHEMQQDFRGHCVYCNHCQPCPADIDIAAVHKFLDIAALDPANVPPSVRSHYADLPRSGADCIACGDCLTRCPFGVPVVDNMRRAAELFPR